MGTFLAGLLNRGLVRGAAPARRRPAAFEAQPARSRAQPEPPVPQTAGQPQYQPAAALPRSQPGAPSPVEIEAPPALPVRSEMPVDRPSRARGPVSDADHDPQVPAASFESPPPVAAGSSPHHMEAALPATPDRFPPERALTLARPVPAEPPALTAAAFSGGELPPPQVLASLAPAAPQQVVRARAPQFQAQVGDSRAEPDRQAGFDSARGLSGPSPSPTVQVTIGRIEIRASQPAPRPVATGAKPAAPRMSLDDYLKARSGGSR